MSKTCAVANCPTGRKPTDERKALFRVPSNSSLRKQWERAVPGYGDSISLKKSQFVCERHFAEQDIARKFRKRDSNGKIIAEVTLAVPHLEKQVVPSVFDASAYEPDERRMQSPVNFQPISTVIPKECSSNIVLPKTTEKPPPKRRCQKIERVPEPKCSIFGCRNNWRTSRRRCENISYHKFPQADTAVRKIWIQRCGKKSQYWNPDLAHICSIHFPEEEFLTALETKYPEVDLDADPELRKLTPSALPSLYLGDDLPLPNPSKTKPVELRLVEEVEDAIIWPEDDTVVDPLQVEEFPISSNNALADGADHILPDNVIVEDPVSNVIVDQVLPDDAMVDHVLPDNAMVDHAFPVNALVNDTLSNNALSKKNLSNDALLKNDLSDNALLKNDLSSNALLNNDLSDDALLNNDLSDDALLNKDSSNDALLNNDFSDDTLLNNDFSDDTLLNNALSNDDTTLKASTDACTQTVFFPKDVKIGKIGKPTLTDIFTQTEIEIIKEKPDPTHCATQTEIEIKKEKIDPTHCATQTEIEIKKEKIDPTHCATQTEIEIKNEKTHTTDRATQTIVEALDCRKCDAEKDLKLALVRCEEHIKRLKTKVRSVEGSLNQANAVIHRKNEANMKLVTELGKKPSDLDRVMCGKCVYNDGDMFKALTIRYMSRQCYSYLTDTLKYPFPSVSRIRTWANKINLREGILEDVFGFIKIAGSTMTDVEKVVILQMDQIKVQSVYEYDEYEDDIIGQYNYMQVITARSLFADWKQPVYIEFDTLITGAKLCTVIRELHELSINVVACVCNPAMEMFIWKELGISSKNTHFRNPSTGAPVHVFSDTPYLLKLLRARFLQYGFVFGENKISAKLLECLLDKTIAGKDDEFRFTEAHLTMSNDVKEQSVTLATQLMSSETASALRNHFADNKNKSVENLSTFMENIDNWYQLANARPSSCTPYGTDIKYQSFVLLIVLNLIRILRCQRRPNMRDFQIGIALSIESLRSLFLDMKMKYDINFIRTDRLNMQDSLEDMFATRQGNRQPRRAPTPVQALRKIRSVVLGNDSSIVKQDENVVSESRDHYIVQKVLQTAEIPHTSDSPLPTSSNQDSLLHIPSPDINCPTEDNTPKYLAGWLATRYGDRFPNVFFSGNESNAENARKPSKMWLLKARTMDCIFRNYHKNGTFQRGKGVTKNVIELMVKKFGHFMPRDVIRAFVMQRTLLKLNLENSKVNGHNS
ncbi:uncharacterized protein LOC125501817 [Athalia rosae]|uniref:uncharacterized protein LOC125501817 n=1 Tax=Athalia rosae TaxID=37344 RepID=UPI00203453BC|nr:uncharacterized protein LOC125501817 [Athalia rosae]